MTTQLSSPPTRAPESSPTRMATLRKNWEWVVSLVAAIVAAVVLCLSLAIVVLPTYRQLPSGQGPFNTGQVTTVTKVSPNGSKETTTTTQPLPLLDRLLTGGAIILLELGIASLAAFLAGATVQRILRGDFAITIGPLTIPELKSATAEGLAKLGERTNRISTRLQRSESLVRQNAEHLDTVDKNHRAQLSELRRWIGSDFQEWATATDKEIRELQDRLGLPDNE